MRIPYLLLAVTLIGSAEWAQAQTPPEKTKSEEALIQATEIRFWLDMYYTDCGQFPKTEAGLQALIEKPRSGCPNWGPDPYTYVIPRDPWGRSWIYSSDGKALELHSLGADGLVGGVGENADISYTWPQ